MSKLNWDNFKDLFGDWDSKIYPFFQKGGFEPIYDFLKSESQRGRKILPDSENVFKAFEKCPHNDLKLCIVGLSPYHTLRDKKSIADGMALSCSITKYPQPSLDQWFSAAEKELYDGLDVNIIRNPDLSYLSSQGILLLNAALTTEYMKPGNHLLRWEPFMQYLFEEVINQTGVPIVFLGREAQKLEKYTAPFSWIFKLSHPASASYNGGEWNSEGMFKAVDKILWERNKDRINWFDSDERIPF